MKVQEYPVTTPYGYVAGYPLHNGFHQGVDYGCPIGTPVIVNGVTIALSGNTGYSSGAHCHVGKWLNGVVQNPLNGGFSFSDATITQIGQDSDNGKFIRVQGDGASWVYCHLSENNIVSVGTKLDKSKEEEEPMFNEGDAVNFNVYIYGKDNGQFRDQVGRDWKTASYNIQEQLKKDKQLIVNDGDVENLKKSGISNAEKANGMDWKDATYSVLLPNLPDSGNPKVEVNGKKYVPA